MLIIPQFQVSYIPYKDFTKKFFKIFSKKHLRIYISNKEIAISDDEAKQIKDYTSQKTEYNSKVKAIRG